MADTVSQGVLDAQVLLEWCRSRGFRVSSVESNGVRLSVDDLKIDPGTPSVLPPRDIHHAWADRLGVDMPKEDGEEDEFR